MYSNNYSIESVQPTPIPVDHAFLLVISLASSEGFLWLLRQMYYSLVNHKCQKFLMFFFAMVSSLWELNVKEHIIPHIPCGIFSGDNYCLLDTSHLI